MADTSEPRATEEDFLKLRHVQLRDLCRDVSAEVGGKKVDLARRLCSCGSWSRHEILAKQQSFTPETPVQKRVARRVEIPTAKREKLVKSKVLRRVSDRIADADLHRVLWAVEEKRIFCKYCNCSLRVRQGRFGTFLACSGTACAKNENLLPALERLGETYRPVRILFELETTDHFRVHARGDRDMSRLRAWMDGIDGGRTADDAPRKTLETLADLTAGVHSCDATRSAFQEISVRDAGLGLDTLAERGSSGELRAGFVFPIEEYSAIHRHLESQACLCDDVESGTPGTRLDELPHSALQFSSMIRARRADVQSPVESEQARLAWAAQLLDRCLEGWRASLSVPSTRSDLIDRLRLCPEGLWEKDLLEVAICVPVEGALLSWRALAEKVANIPADVHALPPKLPHPAAVAAETQRLLSRAFVGAPRLLHLRPFQRTGVARALTLGGRCLIADEMGCGKTPQAVAVLAAYDVWPVLIICPASMRLVWAEELERWLPDMLRPSQIHVVFGSNDMLPQGRLPPDLRICVVSLTMARLLHENLVGRRWAAAVVDESHSLRLVKGLPCVSTRAALELLRPIPRVLLLSGTPSASTYVDLFAQVDLLHPGLLGSCQDFVRDYDDPTLSASGHLVSGHCRRSRQLALLLREGVMVRRLKSEVLSELPPKNRRSLRLAISADNSLAISSQEAEAQTDYERCGLLKAAVSEDWLKDRLRQCGRAAEKMVLFAHHIRVLDRVCVVAELAGIEFIRIDGSTLPPMRHALLSRFRSKDQGAPILAVLGVTACAVGVDLSCASFAVFVELPPDASWLSQAEDRLHRRGQHHPVDIVVLLAHPVGGRGHPVGAVWSCAEVERCCTSDTHRWRTLQLRITEVSAVHDGPEAHCMTVESQPLQSSLHEVKDVSATSATPSEALEFGGAARIELAMREGVDIRFEPSLHTCRLHVFLGNTLLGCSVSPDTDLDKFHPGFSAKVSEFREAWSSLSAYHRRSLRAEPQTASSLLSNLSASSVTGCRKRFVLKRHSSETAERLEDLAPRCRVRVEYANGRLSGKAIDFFQPLDPTTQSRLCMECMSSLDTSVPIELDAVERGPAGETVTHRSTGGEVSLFCTGSCRALFFAKRNAASLRSQLFELERGLCQRCGLDCHSAFHATLAARSDRRAAKLAEVAPSLAAIGELAARIVERPTEGMFWQADHVVPVFEGGGMCGLDNLQTLCTSCHRSKTHAEAERRSTRSQRLRQAPLSGTFPPVRAKWSRQLSMLATSPEPVEDEEKEQAGVSLAPTLADVDVETTETMTACCGKRTRPEQGAGDTLFVKRGIWTCLAQNSEKLSCESAGVGVSRLSEEEGTFTRRPRAFNFALASSNVPPCIDL